MKKSFAIILMGCALVLALGLAACGGSSGGSGSGGAASSAGPTQQQPVQKTDADLILGAWVDEYGSTITFKEDKTIELDESGATANGTYELDESAHTLTLTVGSSMTLNYKYKDDDTLEVSMGDETNTWTRVKDTSGASTGTAPASGPIDVPAQYIDSDGGVTFAAVLGLTGPELTTLLQQQGYEWKSSHWENPTTKDQLEICSSTSKHVNWGIEREEYEAATGKGDLAKGKASIVSHNYDLTNYTTETLEAARDSLAPGMTVENSKVLAFGAVLWSIVTDEAGNRYLLEVEAYDDHTLTASLETDEFLAADDLGSIDEVFN